MTTYVYVGDRGAMSDPCGSPIAVQGEDGVVLLASHVEILGPSRMVFSLEPMQMADGNKTRVRVETEAAIRIQDKGVTYGN